MAEALTRAPAVDPLQDPGRIAAARRPLREVSGHAAFDRLSRLAALLVGTQHAKVTLFTDGDLVVGGHGLPDGVVGGPALLTGALSAITVAGAAPLNLPSATADERVASLPAVTSGQVRSYLGAPLIAASGRPRATHREGPLGEQRDLGVLRAAQRRGEPGQPVEGVVPGDLAEEATRGRDPLRVVQRVDGRGMRRCLGHRGAPFWSRASGAGGPGVPPCCHVGEADHDRPRRNRVRRSPCVVTRGSSACMTRPMRSSWS